MSGSENSLDSARRAVRASIEAPAVYGLRQRTGWVLGPLALLIVLVIPPPEGLSVEGWRTAGVGAMMAVWWVCETIPIPATSLLPLVLFPALGISDIKDSAAPYANPLVFLFLGGFLIALAMQRWNLHRRVALGVIHRMGTRPSRIVLGFLVASALISMWVSNTATAMMMFPIALSVVGLVPKREDPATGMLGVALMLAVAYGSTTGGMATLIGTPPNALLAGFVNEAYGLQIGFGQWMLLGLPLTIMAIPVVYLVLTRVAFRLPREEMIGMRELISVESAKLGPLSKPEHIVAVVFGLTALGWVCQPLLARVVPMLSDTVIAISGALLLFMIPVDARRGVFVMDWKSAKGLPWDVLLLFGGGLSLASNIERHGLSRFIGGLFSGLEAWPVVGLMALICLTILLLTELTSNTATAAAFLPVVAAIALSVGQSPLLFLIPAALAANCSFMLPVGTPPNAVVFGSGLVTLPQMAKTGIWLNMLFVPLVVGAVWLFAGWIFGLEIGVVPEWAR